MGTPALTEKEDRFGLQFKKKNSPYFTDFIPFFLPSLNSPLAVFFLHSFIYFIFLFVLSFFKIFSASCC